MVVPQEFLDEVDVRHDHSSTAVSLAAKCVHRVAVESLVSGTSAKEVCCLSLLTHQARLGQAVEDIVPTGLQPPG